MANFGFNVSEVDPNQGFDAIDAGEYKVIVTDSEMKQTKAGNGQYLQVSLKVLDGSFANRVLFDRFNVVNPNETAQQIGRAQLSSLCHAAGKPGAQDSYELHNIPVIVKVVKIPDEQYGDKNEIKSYKSAGVATPPMGNSAQTGQAAGSPSGAAFPSDLPPWKRAGAA